MKQQTIQAQFNQTIKALLPDSNRLNVGLAVSGGIDSMVLCHLFLHLPKQLRPKRVVVLHVNHQLRQEASVEEQLVIDFCQQQKWDCYTAHWAISDQPKTGVEAAARQFRYHFFTETMRNQALDVLVTAHHGDDQVETMVMKLVRGSHLQGVAGIKQLRPFANGVLIRPLLSFAKEELRSFAEQKSIPYCEDTSNQLQCYQRNRIRHQVAPLLKKENKQLIAHLNATSQQLTDLLKLVEPILEHTFLRLFHENHSGWECSIKEWFELDEVLQRQVLHYLITNRLVSKGIFVPVKEIEKIIYLIHQSEPQKQIDLAQKWCARRVYDRLEICEKSDRTIVENVEQEVQIDLVQYGKKQVQLSPTETVQIDFSGDGRQQVSDHCFYVNAKEFPITIRHRRPQDKLVLQRQPVRHQKVTKWFITQKMPADQRAKCWLLCNRIGEVIAILGHRKPWLLLNDQETGKIMIEYKKIEVSSYVNK